MREIKFRQPRFDDKGNFIDWFYWGFIDNGFIAPLRHDVDNYQSTGLKDKKRTKEFPDGQEIYEGDILKMDYMGIKTAVVRWLDGHFAACGILGAGDHNGSDCEVIGTIHDDLLKEGKE